MHLVSYLKALFAEPVSVPTGTIYHQDAEEFRARHAAYLVQKSEALPLKIEQFKTLYGELETFLYRPDFNDFLRNEFLPTWEPNEQYREFLDSNHWALKHLFNFPGPFYTGESDTCGTGICEAPDNVASDQYCCEYVFRQPQNYDEFLRVLDAAAVEVYGSYSANGNEHWTYAACQHWWRNRDKLMAALNQKETIHANNGQAQAYVEYLSGNAETDLRRYCYFLENGKYPSGQGILLPEL